MNGEGITRRQAGAIVSMIRTITEDCGCSILFEAHEVTVHANDGTGAHAHHRGRTLFEAVMKAKETAREYAAEQRSAQAKSSGGGSPK